MEKEGEAGKTALGGLLCDQAVERAAHNAGISRRYALCIIPTGINCWLFILKWIITEWCKFRNPLISLGTQNTQVLFLPSCFVIQTQPHTQNIRLQNLQSNRECHWRRRETGTRTTCLKGPTPNYCDYTFLYLYNIWACSKGAISRALPCLISAFFGAFVEIWVQCPILCKTSFPSGVPVLFSAERFQSPKTLKLWNQSTRKSMTSTLSCTYLT